MAFDGYRFLTSYSQHLPLALDALFSLPCAVVQVQGKLKGSNERVTMLYVGRRMNYAYLLKTIFDGHAEVESKRTNLLSFRRHMVKLADAADVVIIDMGWPYNGLFNRTGRYAQIPDWVNMAIDLPDTWEGVVRKFRHTTRNNDLRLIRRNGYRYEVTQERAAAEQFYDTMYLPFVRHKHSAESLITPRAHVVKRAMKGQLLRVLREGEVVAAGVIYPQDGVLYFLWMGVPAHYVDTPAEAAISALYFFGIRHAFDNGCRAVDFTGTRAFLNDGALRFKRKWGALIEDTFSPSSILIKPSNGSRSAAVFCERFPTLVRTAAGLEAVFVCADPVDAGTVARLRKEHGCEGIDRFTVIGICDENATVSLPDDSDECEYRLIKSRLECFADHYVNRQTGE